MQCQRDKMKMNKTMISSSSACKDQVSLISWATLKEADEHSIAIYYPGIVLYTVYIYKLSPSISQIYISFLRPQPSMWYDALSKTTKVVNAWLKREKRKKRRGIFPRRKRRSFSLPFLSSFFFEREILFSQILFFFEERWWAWLDHAFKQASKPVS